MTAGDSKEGVKVFPFLVILLAVLYLVLDQTGVIDDFADAMWKRRGGHRTWRPVSSEEPGDDLDAEERLDVFQKFIDELQQSDEDESASQE